MTILVRRTKGGLPANKIRAAGEAISKGRIVVFPTETVYGIGGDALDEDAVRSIFRIKGRPPDNPVIVHIARISDVQPLVSEVPETARILMEAFWPGPLTLVMKKSEAVPKAVTGGLGNVSVRMPANSVALSLIKAAGTPVAAPSANLSGRPSITTFSEAVAELDGRVDFIIDGGKCRIGVESTVVDMTRKIPLLLRPGGLPVEEIERVIGSIDIHPAASGRGKFRGRAPSPGMKYRHYSPVHSSVVLFEKEQTSGPSIAEARDRLLSSGFTVAMLVTDEARLRKGVVVRLGSSKEPERIAKSLFSAMRQLDRSRVDFILAEGIDEKGIGLAVMNRLRRASGGNGPEGLEKLIALKRGAQR